MDALTAQGRFAYLRKNHAPDPATPKVGFGGAGFGGKSYGIRTATLEINGQLAAEGCPGRWGCVMTTTYKQLGDRQMVAMRRELGDYGVIKNTVTRGLHFEFDNKDLGGFFLRNADDPSKYRGAQFDWMLYDELTEITRNEYDDIDYALRSGDRLPFRPFGWASNPDGPGHAWVKGLWIEGDFTNEAAMDPRDYVFIQARATDNPAFDSTIQAKLMGHSDPLKVKARWEGSWDLNFGARFSQFGRVPHAFEWDAFIKQYGGEYGVQQLLQDPDLFTLFASFDYGISEDSASCLLVHATDFKRRVWTLDELYMQGLFLDEQADRINEFLRAFPQPMATIYCDPALRGRDDAGISRWAKFRNRGVRMQLANNNRVEGWATMDELLHYRRNPRTGLIEHEPRWRIHSKCRNLIRQLTSAPRSTKDSNDVDGTFGDDHALDAARYGLHTRFASPASRTEEPDMFSVEWNKRRRRLRNHGKQEKSWAG